MEKTDDQLITEYLGGEETAFALLVTRHLKRVYNFAYRLSDNAEDAEDIAQETFLKAWRNLKKYQHGRSFKAWLFRIAHNTAIDLLRKKKEYMLSSFENEEGENPLLDNLMDPEPLPDQLVERAEDKKLVDSLLDKLSPLYREVLLLRYNDHFTFEEIGEALGKSIHTVKSQHRRALIILHKLLVESSY